jgi:CheY-like chemotaxis protein
MMREFTILITDDQKHMLLLLQASLAPIGCRILTASNGEEALLKASSTTIHLLLIDFEMPGLSGLDTVRQLRRTPAYGDLPVIMITARGQNRIRTDAKEAGVTLVILKPFSPKELLETTRRLLAGYPTVTTDPSPP